MRRSDNREDDARGSEPESNAESLSSSDYDAEDASGLPRGRKPLGTRSPGSSNPLHVGAQRLGQAGVLVLTRLQDVVCPASKGSVDELSV
jgi:hypothetical protein